MYKIFMATAAFAVVALSGCSPTAQSIAPMRTAQPDSVLRVVQGNRATLFGGNASWSRGSNGIIVSVAGRTLSFPGAANPDSVPVTRDNNLRHTRVLPVECATCGDNGGPVPGHGNSPQGSVKQVNADSAHMDVTWASQGNDTITLTGVDANGNQYASFTVSSDFGPNLLVNEWLDSSMFPGGVVFEHGSVTISHNGTQTGSGGW